MGIMTAVFINGYFMLKNKRIPMTRLRRHTLSNMALLITVYLL